MRRVNVYRTYQKKDLLFSGNFHMWGNELAETSDTSVSFTVAIVELDNGKIETPSADRVEFVDNKIKSEEATE